MTTVKSQEDRGYILIASCLVITFLTLLVLPFLFKLSSEYRLTEKSYKSLSALSLAEAGVERAIWELKYGDISSWDGDNNERTMNISSFQAAGGNVIGNVEILVRDPISENPVIEATGRVLFTGSTTIGKTIGVVLKESSDSSIFDFGIFGDEGVELHSNATIDSYDSRDGIYGGDNVSSKGHTGTNGTNVGCIYLYSNAEIYGNAISGYESNPDQVIVTRSNAHIYGNKQALFSIEELPSVPSPEGLPFRGNYSIEGQDTISQSGEYTSFVLNNNSKVTITADVTLYITGDFTMMSNTQLDIAEGVSVTIYLGGSFEQKSNTQVNNLTRDPTKLLVFGTDSFNGNMVWNSNTEFWGALYVPKANVNYDSNYDLYGSVIAKYVNVRSEAKIHYDEALENLDTVIGDGGSTSYTVKSWQEKLSY
ncbi:MAG: hypothetical protein ACETWK_06165 [Candidatus Aminicenantaceae bacterium]